MNTNIIGFKNVFKNLCILMLWTKVAWKGSCKEYTHMQDLEILLSLTPKNAG